MSPIGRRESFDLVFSIRRAGKKMTLFGAVLSACRTPLLSADGCVNTFLRMTFIFTSFYARDEFESHMYIRRLLYRCIIIPLD